MSAERAEPVGVAAHDVAVDAELQEVRLHEAEDLLHRREEQRRPEDRRGTAARTSTGGGSGARRTPCRARPRRAMSAIRSPRARPRAPAGGRGRRRRRRARGACRGPRLDDAPLVEHDDQVGLLHGGDAVRDEDASSARGRSRAGGRGSPARSCASTLESASSRISTCGARPRARAPARPAASGPPESVTPRSPTTVSSPAGMSARSRASAGRLRPPTRRGSLVLAARAPKADVLADGAREEERVLRHEADAGGGASRAAACGRRGRRAARCRRSTSKSRGRSCTSVVFPAPVRPTIATVRPAGMRERRRRRARAAPSRPAGIAEGHAARARSRRGTASIGVAPGGLAIAGSTANSSFSRCIAARPRWRTDSIQPSAIVGHASRWR